MIQYVSFGIVIDDIMLADGTTMLGVLGGGGPQTAWGMAAALGTGKTVGISGIIGRDCTPQILRPLTNTGVDVTGLTQVNRLTPRAWQRFDSAGTRTHVWRVPPQPGEEVYRTALDALPSAYQTARGMHWGLHPENPSLPYAHRFAEHGAVVSLETFRPPDEPQPLDKLHELVTSCTVFSPSWGEASAMVGSTDMTTVIRTFKEAGCRLLAIRRGEQGGDLWDFREGKPEGFHVPAVPTTIVDTTGAGNAFCGAFLARLDDGIAAAGSHAATAASYLLEQFGIPDHLPDKEDYRRRLDYATTKRERLVL